MLDGIQAIATTTANAQNFYLHVGELGSKLSDLLKILPGAQWGVEAGKGLLMGWLVMDQAVPPIAMGNGRGHLLRIGLQRTRRSENKQDDAKLEDPIVKLDPPTNQIFAAIERNTQRIADVMENKTLGTKYDTFLNPVNLRGSVEVLPRAWPRKAARTWRRLVLCSLRIDTKAVERPGLVVPGPFSLIFDHEQSRVQQNPLFVTIKGLCGTVESFEDAWIDRSCTRSCSVPCASNGGVWEHRTAGFCTANNQRIRV